MLILNITNFLSASFFIFLTALLLSEKFNENIRNLLKRKKTLKNSESQENSESEKTEELKEIKFEEKYLEKWLATEVNDLSEERLESLKNSFIIENTPQGNVIMFWDNKKETFVYYADHIIPYRFLEVVGRKYVITNDCKKIYINMEEEIKMAKQKKEEKEQKEEETQEKQKNNEIQENNEKPKRNVFAKLKSYNKDSSIKSAVVPLNSKKTNPTNISKMPVTSASAKKEEDFILKENANRYSYQGRLANFSFLKKVDRKLVDKKYALSFAEFKKMNSQNKN